MGDRNAEVDVYLEGVPETHRLALDTLRDLIHGAHPEIEESIQYKMPTFSLGGEMVSGFSLRAQYVSLYCKPEVVNSYRDELGKLNVGKGCIRFRKLEQLPLETIQEIIRKSS